MGRDLTLYTKNATREELCEYLKGLGFVPTNHLWKWPEGTRNFSWFDFEDYRSIDGVSADVYPPEKEDGIEQSCKWALHVRNLYSASWHDVRMLNQVLKGARKRFGGTIMGDYGKNRYAPLWNDESTPMSRGVSSVFSYVTNQISAVKYALPAASVGVDVSKETRDNHEIVELMRSLDPARVIYNGLVLFAVAMFEYFFSRVFQVLIRYDEFALEKRKSHRRSMTRKKSGRVVSHLRFNVVADLRQNATPRPQRRKALSVDKARVQHDKPGCPRAVDDFLSEQRLPHPRSALYRIHRLAASKRDLYQLIRPGPLCLPSDKYLSHLRAPPGSPVAKQPSGPPPCDWRFRSSRRYAAGGCRRCTD